MISEKQQREPIDKRMSLDFNSKRSSTVLLDDHKQCQERGFDAQ